MAFPPGGRQPHLRGDRGGTPDRVRARRGRPCVRLARRADHPAVGGNMTNYSAAQAAEERAAEAEAQEAAAQDGSAPEETDDRAWYIVQTYSGYENKVKTNLEQRVKAMDKGGEIF